MLWIVKKKAILKKKTYLKKIFLKSFILSALIFSIFSAVIIYAAYSTAISVDPQNEESNILLAVVDDKQNNLLSLAVVNVDPINNAISFVSVPDNTVIEENFLLQSIYKTEGISQLEKRTEELLGVKIARYLIFSTDKIKEITDAMGDFAHAISYPFEYDNKEYSGTELINGTLASEMFLYDSYDLTSVSLAEIGISFLQSFLSKYANEQSINKLVEVMIERDYCNSRFTDLSEKEMREYAKVLSNYPSMTHRNEHIKGEYNRTSARSYFIPEKTKSDKNIFEK